VLVWELSRGSEDNYGTPKRSLRGHSHFVQDLVISSDGQFCLTGGSSCLLGGASGGTRAQSCQRAQEPTSKCGDLQASGHAQR
jgi:hypothetical protein